MLKLESLTVHYGDFYALDSFSAAIPGREITTILGPSGCGKSTLLGAVAGILLPSKGYVALDKQVFFDTDSGRNLPPEKRNIGFVFQNYALWPHLNLTRNLDYPLRVRKKSREERESSVQKTLSLIHLRGKEKRYPHELSGGEQQRAALGRALITEPDLLLMDEPLSNLDARLREEMQEEIRSLQQRLQLTILHVTHDQSEALAMSDHIIVMHDGRSVQEGAPRHIYRDPASSFSADFVGKSNLLKGQTEHRNNRLFFRCGEKEMLIPESFYKSPRPENTLFSLRPEDIIIGKTKGTGNIIPAGTGIVERAIYRGASTLYLVRWGSELLRVLGNTEHPLRSGAKIELSFGRMVQLEN